MGLKHPKVEEWTQKEPEDREEAWGQIGVLTFGKWATWVSRRESCLSFSILSSTLEKMGLQGSGKPMVMRYYKIKKNHNRSLL